jgi:hypothetical protein
MKEEIKKTKNQNNEMKEEIKKPNKNQNNEMKEIKKPNKNETKEEIKKPNKNEITKEEIKRKSNEITNKEKSKKIIIQNLNDDNEKIKSKISEFSGIEKKNLPNFLPKIPKKNKTNIPTLNFEEEHIFHIREKYDDDIEIIENSDKNLKRKNEEKDDSGIKKRKGDSLIQHEENIDKIIEDDDFDNDYGFGNNDIEINENNNENIDDIEINENKNEKEIIEKNKERENEMENEIKKENEINEILKNIPSIKLIKINDEKNEIKYQKNLFENDYEENKENFDNNIFIPEFKKKDEISEILIEKKILLDLFENHNFNFVFETKKQFIIKPPIISDSSKMLRNFNLIFKNDNFKIFLYKRKKIIHPIDYHSKLSLKKYSFDLFYFSFSFYIHSIHDEPDQKRNIFDIIVSSKIDDEKRTEFFNFYNLMNHLHKIQSNVHDLLVYPDPSFLKLMVMNYDFLVDQNFVWNSEGYYSAVKNSFIQDVNCFTIDFVSNDEFLSFSLFNKNIVFE